MTNHKPNDLSHLSDAEFHSLCPQGEHAPGPSITEEQEAVLVAGLDLVNGGLDLEECLYCYAVISKYVIDNPPQPKNQ